MKTKLWLMTGLFSTINAFILGLACLFLVMVPIEEFLQKSGATEFQVRIVMVLLILLWAISALGATLINYYYLKVKGIGLKQWRTLGVMMVLVAGLFVSLLKADVTPVALLQGTKVVTTKGYTIGPYPDEATLKELKAQGYTDVVTLLSPVIPFEGMLLDSELDNGEKVGIAIHSFPMLPWVSDNALPLQSILDLIKENNGKVYIHCYLGKHRVNMVRNFLAEQLGDEAARQAFLLPDSLERGSLLTYKNGQLLLGALPTDEEWFFLLGQVGIKEVISVLDEDEPEDVKRIAKEKQLCEQFGIKFTSIPLKIEKDFVSGGESLEVYLEGIKHKVFLHSFKEDERFNYLDGFLRTNKWEPINRGELEPKLRNQYYGLPEETILEIGEKDTELITNRIMVGPVPNQVELKSLEELGINELVELSAKDFDKGFVDGIISRMTEDNMLLYIAAPSERVHQAKTELRSVIN